MFGVNSRHKNAKFVTKSNWQYTERILWLLGFVTGLAAAIFLIHRLFENYHAVPVIVTFQSSPQDTDTIAFPAVTLCNINKFPKYKVRELENIWRNMSFTNSERKQARRQMEFIRNMCNDQTSFAKSMGFAHGRGKISQFKDTIVISEKDHSEMFDFLMQNTLPCDQLIRLCKFGDVKQNCSHLFKPIITDYGKCCSFNILPLPLLKLSPDRQPDASEYNKTLLGNFEAKTWSEEELQSWSEWNYDESHVLSRSHRRPWRQRRAGYSYGLSILVDPNVDDYYCPAQDSLGLLYVLHSPLELPQILEFAYMVDLNQEIAVDITPHITRATADIRWVDQKKRSCYFGKEKELSYFGPYTTRNCLDECTAKFLEKECTCSLFYMPRSKGIRVCDAAPHSIDNNCVLQSRLKIQENLKNICGDCYSLCENIEYQSEATLAQMQSSSKLWADPDPTLYPNGAPAWHNHQMSIMHFFIGTESVAPKLRKRLYSTTELIASTGGILGLCLGFSMFSAIKVLYVISVCSFWKFLGKGLRRLKKQVHRQLNCKRKAINCSATHKCKKQTSVIQLDPNIIPIHPWTILKQARSDYSTNRFAKPGKGFVFVW